MAGRLVRWLLCALPDQQREVFVIMCHAAFLQNTCNKCAAQILVQGGVKLAFRRPRGTTEQNKMVLHHAKLMLADAQVLWMGSANFTLNSLEKCEEAITITSVVAQVKPLVPMFGDWWRSSLHYHDVTRPLPDDAEIQLLANDRHWHTVDRHKGERRAQSAPRNAGRKG